MDQRTRRTRMALAEALMTLAPKIGLDEIEIRRLTEEAGVGRSTFYAHYLDKDDFLVTSYGAMVQAFDEHARKSVDYCAVLPSRDVFAHVESARAFALSLVHSEQFARMQAARESRLYPIAEANLARLYPAMVLARRRELAVFLSGAFSGLMRWWMEGGLRQSAAHMHEVFETLANRILADELAGL
jgi:AcrR family transcriptional regulator